MKKLHTVLLLLGVGLLIYLVGKTGFRTLCDEMISLGWGLVLFILLEFVAEGIHTVAWSCCLNARCHHLPWFWLLVSWFK